MATQVVGAYTFALSEDERATLLDVLEQALKTVQVEEHRTDSLRAKQVVHAREETLEALVRKVRAAGPG